MSEEDFNRKVKETVDEMFIKNFLSLIYGTNPKGKLKKLYENDLIELKELKSKGNQDD